MRTLDKIQHTILSHQLIKPGQHIVAAVSGGADSTAMLLALERLSQRRRFTLSVVHLNHRLRGGDADRDEEFVRRLAVKLDLPFHSERRDVKALARDKKISVEMAAREARHDLYRRVLSASGADAIATAHTVDDQAETILMRIFRGTGADGLAGIDHETRMGSLRIIRPMLEVTRNEGRAFLRASRQRWREDKSNRSPAHLRNRIRNEIIPLIEKRVNPSLRTALARWAEIQRADNAALEALTQKSLKQITQRDSLRVGALARLEPGAQRRVIRSWLMERGVAAQVLDFDFIERVRSLAASPRASGETPISARERVVRRYGLLSIAAQADSAAFKVKVSVPGVTALRWLGLTIETEWWTGVVRPKRVRPGKWPAEATLSRRAIGRSALIARSWRSGDRIKPLGMAGSQKLQDIFTNAKVPREERHRIPVVECRGEIVWVPGHCVTRGWGVESEGAKSLRIILKC